MNRWIDVKSTDWFYGAVQECSNLIMRDGTPFIQGMLYQNFESGSPYVYREITATQGQKEFTLTGISVQPSNVNPFMVYIDGVRYLYKSVEINSVGGTKGSGTFTVTAAATTEENQTCFTLGGVLQLLYDVDTGMTTEEIATKLAEAINEVPGPSTWYSAEVIGSVVTVTSVNEGLSIAGGGCVEGDADNPSGVTIVYAEVAAGSSGSGGTDTIVTLYNAPREGAVVSFASYGIPEIDGNGRPVGYGTDFVFPRTYALPWYTYTQYSRETITVVGKRLRRVNSASDSNTDLMKAIGTRSDVYWIDAVGHIYVPMNLNGATIRAVYDTEYGQFDATAVATTGNSNPLYNNRYFPQAHMTRAEFYTLLNKLRIMLVERFTDVPEVVPGIDQTILSYNGQKVFRLNGYYPSDNNSLEVKVNGYTKTPGVDYDEWDISDDSTNGTVVFKEPMVKDQIVTFKYTKTASRRFSDITSADWYFNSILEYEDLKLEPEVSDVLPVDVYSTLGTYVLDGIGSNTEMTYTYTATAPTGAGNVKFTIGGVERTITGIAGNETAAAIASLVGSYITNMAGSPYNCTYGTSEIVTVTTKTNGASVSGASGAGTSGATVAYSVYNPGNLISTFNGSDFVYRKEMAVAMDRLRRWILERLR